MNICFRIGLVVIAAAAATATLGGDSYPSRPITIIAPTTAGGPPDTIARLIGERMKLSLGQPILVENITGAGGSIGVARVVRAPPDGYTLSIGHINSHVFSGVAYALPFDLLTDLAPIALLTTSPQVFIGRGSLPPNTLKELVPWLRTHPNTSFGSVGMGGPGRVWGTYFANTIEARFQFVPYRGAASFMQDLIAGQIDVAAAEGSNIVPHLGRSNIKAYAVLSKTRWAAAPDIVTINEAGGPALYPTFWHGLWAPKGTPPDVIARLNAVVVDALADPAVRARLAQIGHDVVPRSQQTPEALGALHKAEIER